jgi:hypothetical protein
MEAEPVEGEPAVNGIEAVENGALPPRDSRQGPPGADVRQIRELAGRAIHPDPQAVAAEHHRVADGAAHRYSLGGEAAEIDVDGFKVFAHFGGMDGNKGAIEAIDEDVTNVLEMRAHRDVAGVKLPLLKQCGIGSQGKQAPPFPPNRGSCPSLLQGSDGWSDAMYASGQDAFSHGHPFAAA